MARSSSRSPDDFNASQTEFKVIPTYKGGYPETLTAAIAAFRANEQPAIVQVFEVGTGTMMAAKGAVNPVYQLMTDNGEPWDPSGSPRSVTGYYSDTDGNILSMPFNSSTPIMYYNKDAFEKAGLDPKYLQRPGAELETIGRQIVESGATPMRASAALGSPGSRPKTFRPSITCPSGTLRKWLWRRLGTNSSSMARIAGPALGQSQEMGRRRPLPIWRPGRRPLMLRKILLPRNARSS